MACLVSEIRTLKISVFPYILITRTQSGPNLRLYRKVSNLKPAYPTNEAWYKTEICKSVCSHRVLSMVGRSRCWEKFNGRGMVLESPLVQMMSNNTQVYLVSSPDPPYHAPSGHGVEGLGTRLTNTSKNFKLWRAEAKSITPSIVLPRTKNVIPSEELHTSSEEKGRYSIFQIRYGHVI